MWRRALTYQLILAVAVGPLLCCCSVGKSLAGSPPASGTPASDRAPVTQVSHSCCSHKHHAPSKSDSGQKSAPAKPGQPTGKCPCKDGTDKSQLAQAELTQADLSTFLRVLTLDTFISFASPAPVETAPEANGLDAGGFLDYSRCPTDELLYAHHNLRC